MPGDLEGSLFALEKLPPLARQLMAGLSQVHRPEVLFASTGSPFFINFGGRWSRRSQERFVCSFTSWHERPPCIFPQQFLSLWTCDVRQGCRHMTWWCKYKREQYNDLTILWRAGEGSVNVILASRKRRGLAAYHIIKSISETASGRVNNHCFICVFFCRTELFLLYSRSHKFYFNNGQLLPLI